MRTENRSWHRSGAIPGWPLPVQINPALHRCCFFVLFFSFCGPDEVPAPSLPICSAVENSWHRVGREWHCPSGSSTSTLAPWGSFTELSLVLDTFNPHFLEAERLGRACCSSGAGEKPPGFFCGRKSDEGCSGAPLWDSTHSEFFPAQNPLHPHFIHTKSSWGWRWLCQGCLGLIN